MAGPIRAVVYSRVSTDAQERDGTSLDTQERACEEYVNANGWVLVESIRDTASGSSLDRPGIEKLRLLLRECTVGVVVAYDVDRLSRNQNQIEVLFDEAEQAGTQLQFVMEKFEDTATGRFILAARAFIGEVEREKISERTMRGKAERARTGKIPQGTGIGCYGYRYNPETGRREIHTDQANVVRRIFEKFCNGDGCSKIATALNREGTPAFSGGQWHPLTIRRMLSNETYTGKTVYRRTKVEFTRSPRGDKKRRKVVVRPENEWIDVEGATPPIIPNMMYTNSQAILQDPDRRLLGRPSRLYRLRGRLRCLTCNTPMVGQSQWKGRFCYYRCRRSFSGDFEGTCDARYIRMEKLDRTVLEQLSLVLSDPDRILDEARRMASQNTDAGRLEAIKREMGHVEEKQRRLADLYLGGSIPDSVLKAKGEELDQLRVGLEKELQGIRRPRPHEMDLSSLTSDLHGTASRLHRWVMEASGDDMALILQALQVQVTASNDEVRIEGALPAMVPGDRDLVTIVQTSGCLYNERLALNTLPMNYVFFERPLYSNSGSQAHAITG